MQINQTFFHEPLYFRDKWLLNTTKLPYFHETLHAPKQLYNNVLTHIDETNFDEINPISNNIHLNE